MHNQRNFAQLQAPTRLPFPINLSAAQGMRASSNPEHGRPQAQGGPLRHLPGPPGQFPISQGHLPLQRLTSSTEILELVCPGSTSRGDFHSDCTAHNAMDTYNFGPPDDYVAIPSRGLPGPFTYQPLPPLTQPVPLLDRVGTFNGNVPKGKKNPEKKSSDDARIVSITENGPCEASNGANPKRPFPPQNIQMPFYPRSPDAIPLGQALRPSAGTVPYPGNYHQPGLPPGHHSGHGQEQFHHPPHHRQAPIQTSMEDPTLVTSNPYSPLAHGLPGLTQDFRPVEPTIPMPTSVQHQGATMTGQLLEENAGSGSTQVRSHISQPMDPHAFGHQPPDPRMDAQGRNDPIPQFQRPALAAVSNAGQPQLSGTSWRSRANEISRRPMQEGCKLWIGLPGKFDKAAVMALLRPCRGLVDVSEPRESTNHSNCSYAFAKYVPPISSIARNTDPRNHSFQTPADAAEALERLPQTHFASLPEGTFLSTNYAKPKPYQSPGHCQRGIGGDSKRPVSSVSPTKSRKGEDSNRVGKSKKEHGRKPSKGSVRGKKPSTSSSEGKLGKPSERFHAVDAAQKESDLQPEEAIVIPCPHGKAESMVHVRLSSTESQSSKPMSQDIGVIQSDAGVETRTNQISAITDHGAQDISSAPSPKPQAPESHQATSLTYTEGRTKAPKKKSKDSNKLPVPGNKGQEPPTVQPAYGTAEPKARAKPFANDAGKVLEDSGDLKGKGKRAEFGIDASKTIVPTVPLEPTSTTPKDLETADQSFLGRNPTEGDGEQPKASVANVTKPSAANDVKAEMSETAPAPLESAPSAVPLEQSKEPISQAMRRVSNSAQGSADTAASILSSTAAPSSSQTERSNNITLETLSPTSQTACPSLEAALLPVVFEPSQLRGKLEVSIVSSNVSQSGTAVIPEYDCKEDSLSQEAISNAEFPVPIAELGETVMEQQSETPTSLAPSETGNSTKGVQEGLPNLINRVFGGFQPGLFEENPAQTPSMMSIQPSPSKSDQAFRRSPARKRAPSIPPRSSSLAAPSTPIKTHQKKKPRNLKPVKEASPSRATGLPLESTQMDSSLQTTRCTKLKFPFLTIDSAARPLTNDKSKGLPKPETPFLMDDGVKVPPPKITRQVVDGSSADRYYAQKNNYQVFHLGNAMQINATFNGHDFSDSTSTPSETSTPDYASVKEQPDLETTLREAGYRSLSGTSPFTIKDPELALLDTIDEEWNPLENNTKKDERLLSWVDDKGNIGGAISFDAWTKQNEMIEVVKKATAVKRFLADSPPLPWTKIESHRQQLSGFVTHSFSDAQEQQSTETTVRQSLEARALLNAAPQRDSSISETRKWTRKVSLFMEQNASEPSPAYAQPRKPKTDSPGKSSRGRPSQERWHPVLINKPDPHILARKLGGDDDAVRFVNTELSNSLTSGQTTESESSPSTFGRRTPSEEQLTPSVILIPSAALDQVSKLKDIFVEMGKDRRRWSDDRHRVGSPQEGERMTSSDPELKPSGEEFDVRGMTDVKDVEPKQEAKETKIEVQQKPHEDEPSESKGKELDSEDRKQDQKTTIRSDDTENPTSAESKEKTPEKSENLTHQRQISQPFEKSFSSFGSDFTTSNEGNSEEAQHIRPRGGHSPIKRSGYNAVAGRSNDRKRAGKKEASKDPWALPQGETPWGSGGRGRGEKKKRERP